MSFVPDASPRIDVVADVDDIPVVSAKGFWVHHLMAPAAVGWLDNALQGGTVHAGHAVISGALADWPFADDPAAGALAARKENTGVFKPWPRSAAHC